MPSGAAAPLWRSCAVGRAAGVAKSASAAGRSHPRFAARPRRRAAAFAAAAARLSDARPDPGRQTLASAPDVREVLDARFGMKGWFTRNGYQLDCVWEQQQQPGPLDVAKAHAAEAAQPPDASAAPDPAPAAAAAADQAPADLQVIVEDAPREPGRPLLVFDFDKTLTDWDAGERLVGELGPELVPWLSSLEQPANFVPITNQALHELARRGTSRDRLLSTLQQLGSELPAATVDMLRWAQRERLHVKVLSDCNSVFISHILAGARLAAGGPKGHIEVVTNPAAFERVAAAEAGGAGVGLGAGRRGAAAAASYKLVISPRHPASAAPHGCPLCPANLCKGAELARLRGGAAGGKLRGAGFARVVYAGDGANDICPALSLGAGDVVLARAGAALAKYAAAGGGGGGARPLRARVVVWETHEQLAQLVREHAGSCE